MGIMKTRKLVQGAMIAGICGVLSLINTYTGDFFDIFMGYAMTIGLVWYSCQYTLKDSIICGIATMLVVAMVGTPYFSIIAFTSVLNGIVVGELLKKKSPLSHICIAVTGICLLNNLLIYELFSGLVGIDLVGELKVAYDMAAGYYPEIVTMVPMDALISMLPTALVLLSVLEMYVIVMFLSLASLKLKFPFPKYVHISNLRISRKWGYIIAIGMFGGYGLTFIKGIDPHIGQYIYFISSLGYMLQGIATLNFIAIVFKQRWLMIVSILIVFIPSVNSILTILGMIDIFSDLRRNLLYNSQ